VRNASHSTRDAVTTMEPLITLRGASLRVGERTLFTETSWVIRRGEHWGIVGPTGSGKSLLASALCGQVPVVGGAIRYHFTQGEGRAWFADGSVIRVSSDDHRRVVEALVGFHQGRWHASEERASETVDELLTRQSVEAINPFQALPDRDAPETFARRRNAVTAPSALSRS